MDTPRELRRDEWWQDHLGCCGTCDYKEYGVCVKQGNECIGVCVPDEAGCSEYKQKKPPTRASRFK